MKTLPHKLSTLLRHSIKCQDEQVKNGIVPKSNAYFNEYGGYHEYKGDLECGLAGAVVLTYNESITPEDLDEVLFPAMRTKEIQLFNDIIGLIESFRKSHKDTPNRYDGLFNRLGLGEHLDAYNVITKKCKPLWSIQYYGKSEWIKAKGELLQLFNELKLAGI